MVGVAAGLEQLFRRAAEGTDLLTRSADVLAEDLHLALDLPDALGTSFYDNAQHQERTGEQQRGAELEQGGLLKLAVADSGVRHERSTRGDEREHRDPCPQVQTPDELTQEGPLSRRRCLRSTRDATTT